MFEFKKTALIGLAISSLALTGCLSSGGGDDDDEEQGKDEPNHPLHQVCHVEVFHHDCHEENHVRPREL